MSSPTPGRMPTNTPISPERMMVRQWRSTSAIFGSTESTELIMAFSLGWLITVRISAKPKAPTSAGISPMPPLIALLSKVKRACAWIGSRPMVATKMPSSPISQPLIGSAPVRLPDIITPTMPSQKNSKAPNFNAVSASSGVNIARQTTPNSEPATEPVVAMPIARPALPCRASAWPSRQAAALAAVPGMLSKIAVRLPP